MVLVTQDQLSLDRLHLGRKNASISSPIRAHRKGHDETLIELKTACTRDRHGEWRARIVEEGSVCHAHVVSVAVAIPTQDGRGQLVTWSTRDFCDASRFFSPLQNRITTSRASHWVFTYHGIHQRLHRLTSPPRRRGSSDRDPCCSFPPSRAELSARPGNHGCPRLALACQAFRLISLAPRGRCKPQRHRENRNCIITLLCISYHNVVIYDSFVSPELSQSRPSLYPLSKVDPPLPDSPPSWIITFNIQPPGRLDLLRIIKEPVLDQP